MDTKIFARSGWSRAWLACAFLGLTLLSVPFWGSDAQAECRVVSTAPIYLLGKLQSISCDVRGNIGVGGGPGSTTSAAPTFVEGSAGYFSFDLAGNVRFTLGTQLSGEDIAATGGGSASGVTVVEHRYLTSGPYTADQQIKASAGYVSHLSCQGSDAAAVAGTIILYDSLTETSTAKFTFTVAALDYHNWQILPVQSAFGTGIYLGYTTTTDVACTVHYR